MKNMILQETKFSPEVILDTNGIISFKGKSYPENIGAFYAPIMKWIRDYFKTEVTHLTTVSFDMTYLNSGSSKLFFVLLTLLEEVSTNYKIKIIWMYDAENENAQENGDGFKEDFKNINIELVKK